MGPLGLLDRGANFIATGHDMDFHCSGGDPPDGYTVTLTNSGTAAAPVTAIVDTLPAGLAPAAPDRSPLKVVLEPADNDLLKDFFSLADFP